MTRPRSFAAILLVVVTAGWASVEACGDKFLMVGRGARFQGAYRSVHPGKILIYTHPSTATKAAIRNPDFHKALRQAGHATDEQTVQRFLRIHERGLPGYLHRRQGHVMPGVREVLEAFRDRDDVRSLLLTGNTELGAVAKLAHYGLAGYFPYGGAFCVGPGERTEIARRALALADGAPDMYVIGDTPADVSCGKAIGARTIAVATGSYSVAELEAHDPWRTLECLLPPDQLAALLGI